MNAPRFEHNRQLGKVPEIVDSCLVFPIEVDIIPSLPFLLIALEIPCMKRASSIAGYSVMLR